MQVRQTHQILVYWIRDGAVEIARVFHTSRQPCAESAPSDSDDDESAPAT